MNRLLICIAVLLLLLPGATLAQEGLTIEGQVVQGTRNGAPLPDNMPVSLIIISPTAGIVETYQTVAGPDGTFIFNNVPEREDHRYAVSTEYANIPQLSTPQALDELDFIELTVYETSPTFNPDQVRVMQGNMILDFDELQDLGLAVILEATILNISDRIIFGGDSSFSVELPVGAFSVAPLVSEGANIDASPMIRVDDGTIPIVRDQAPILPGVPHTLRISYVVPYELGAVVHQVFPVAITNMSIWVPQGSVQVESEHHEQSPDSVEENGLTYTAYDQTDVIEPGEDGDADLIFTLQGLPPQVSLRNNNQDDDDGGFNLLLPALAAILLLIVGVFWVFVRRGTDSPV